MDILEFRDYCLSLPFTEESTPFDETTLVYKVGGKMYACADMVGFGHFAVKCDPDEALRSAVRIIKESGAAAVKLEGGREIKESVEKILSAGIPVMAHLGLTPQSVNKFGGYGVRAKGDAEATRLTEDAMMLQDLGCFSVVFEKIPAELASTVSKQLAIPTIGIGAGSGTDGQVLVLQDMLGMNNGFRPKFLRLYANLAETIDGALKQYISDVKNLTFPTLEESY